MTTTAEMGQVLLDALGDFAIHCPSCPNAVGTLVHGWDLIAESQSVISLAQFAFKSTY